MSKTWLTRKSCRKYIGEKLFNPGGMPLIKEGSEKIGSIGIEIEAFPYFHHSEKENVFLPVPLYGGQNSLMKAIIAASKPFGGVGTYITSAESRAIKNQQFDKIEFPGGECFLFEPGGQVEIRTTPCKSILELQTQLQWSQEILQKVTQTSKIHFGQTGTNALFDADSIGNQINKTRYRALEKYFDGIGPFGKQMMLQTCSMHINVDLGKEETIQVQRIVAANLLVPFVTALFANSPNISGKSSGFKAYRSFIWQNTDQTRTGILPMEKVLTTMSKEDIIDLYLSFALQAPLIFIAELGDRVLPQNITLDYWLKNAIEGVYPDISHLENHLSLLFPEVRPRGYLELRTVDAPPVEWQMVPVCFYAGLLYSDHHLEKTLELLVPLASQIKTLYKHSTHGFESVEIFNTSKKLMQLAIEGFSHLPEDFKTDAHLKQLIAFFERFTLQRKSFSDGFSG